MEVAMKNLQERIQGQYRLYYIVQQGKALGNLENVNECRPAIAQDGG